MAEQLEEVVTRARTHLLSAWSETIEAAQALFEAAGIATDRAGPTARHSAANTAGAGSDPLRAGLDELMSALRRARLLEPPPALMQSLSQALEQEIRRWEARSRGDPEARLVLRAFLVLRELSWELGMAHSTPHASGAAPRTDDPVRPAADEPASPRPAARRRARQRPRTARDPAKTTTRSPRVQRFDIEQG